MHVTASYNYSYSPDLPAWVGLIYLGFFVFFLAVDWKLFKKMGRRGWECLIPIYNMYAFYKSVYGNGWRFLLLLIPFVNIYIAIKFEVDLAKRFGKGTGFALGLIFLPLIFMPILAFGDASFTPGVDDGSFAIKD